MIALKITGFILLGLLALILLVLAAVLFVPVRYTGNFAKREKELKGDAKITWFFGFLTVKLQYAKKRFKSSIRVAFFKPKTGKPKEEEPKKEEKSKTAGSVKKPRKKKKQKPQKLSFLQRLKNLFKNRDEVLELIEETRPQAVKAFKRIKKLILHVIPQKIRGELCFGFSDPSTTGKVLGLISAIYGAMGPLLDLSPDFENERFDCDISFKGRIRIFTVALILILLYFNKELHHAQDRLKALSEKA